MLITVRLLICKILARYEPCTAFSLPTGRRLYNFFSCFVSVACWLGNFRPLKFKAVCMKSMLFTSFLLGCRLLSSPQNCVGLFRCIPETRALVERSFYLDFFN